MADLSIIYSKTGKGMRARNAADAGLLPKQLKLLALIDGKSTASEILTQSKLLSEKELAGALSQLEMNGFIRPLPAALSTAEDWALTSNFTPMVVEEFKNEAEIEAGALAKAQAKIAHEKQHAERIAAEKAKEKISWKAEIKARKVAEAKTQLDEKARLKAVQLIHAENLIKAENLAQLEAKRQAKAELKLLQEAQQAAEQAQLEAQRIENAKLAQLAAQRIAKEENDAQLEAARLAKAALILQLDLQHDLQLKAQQKAEQATLAISLARINKAEKETAEAVAKAATRLEMARIIGKAEAERKQAESQLKEARQQVKRQIKAEEQARVKAVRQAKEAEKQADIDTKAAENNKVLQQESIQMEINRLAHRTEHAKKVVKAAKNNDEHNAEDKAEDNAVNYTKAFQQAELAQLEASPKLDLAADKIAQQQDEAQAMDERQAATLQDKGADSQKQLAAQQAQEKAEQIRARNEADEKAVLAEKALARLEMARIAREADALRSQAVQPFATKPTKSGRFEASKSTQLKSAASKTTTQAFQHTAVKKNAVNGVDVQAKEADKRADSAVTDKQFDAKPHAEIKAPTQTTGTPIHLSVLLLNCVKRLVKLLKITLTIGFISALLLIAVLHFINISPLIAPIEKLATVSLGNPVHIEQVRASLWPQPHFTLVNVAIGEALKVTSLQIVPDATTLFADVKHVKSLKIQGFTIDHNNLEPSLNMIKQLSNTPTLKIAQLNISDLSFKANDLVLGPFGGNLALSAAGELASLDLQRVDSTLIVQIKPLGTDYAVTLTGNHWPLPLKPQMVFDTLKANAIIHQHQMTVSQIEGAIFGGNISAQAVLDWSTSWRTTGKFKLTSANAPQLLTAFASKTGVNGKTSAEDKANIDKKASVEGKLSMTGDFASQSIEALNLADASSIFANIALKNGKINGVDLAKAVLNQSASLAGEATEFDTLSASLQVKNGQYQYKQIVLITKQFHAIGYLNIAQNQSLTGKVNANLAAQSRRLQANFDLSGTINHVKRH
ncbi:MAG: hypothetical protein H7Z20_09060 [Bdellovibrio sp.]|nr:hypothetical protein [Methylotenera sp.]